MRLRNEEIEYASWQIIRRLKEEGKIEPLASEEELLGKVRQFLTEDLMVEDRLNREVDDIIKDHLNEMQRESVDYRRMFQLIKNKLARERNLIL